MSGERAPVAVVVVVRDPDASNEYRQWSSVGPVLEVDIDAGANDLSDPATYREWSDTHYAIAADLELTGWADAARYVRAVVDSYRRDDPVSR